MAGLIRSLRPLVSKSPALSSLYRDWRDRRALARAPEPTVLGFRFNGNEAMARGEFEPVETRHISRLLGEVSVVVNVGANIGYYCCLALNAGKKVVAFEPMPTNQRYLMRNVFVNGWEDRFELYPLALSDRTGLIEIWGGGTGASLVKGWSGQTYSTLVPVSTLDVVLADRFSDQSRLIIVDVEGAEAALLRGAGLMLASPNPPIWFVEITFADHQPSGVAINPHLLEIFAGFDTRGYAAIIADEAPRVVELAEIRVCADQGRDPFSLHNFIFAPIARAESVLALLRS
jgi:FkbM family methyltransferase